MSTATHNVAQVRNSDDNPNYEKARTAEAWYGSVRGLPPLGTTQHSYYRTQAVWSR